MAAYNCEEDFITRTREIVNGNPQGNEVTMLLNCMLGLLVFPQEKYLKPIEKGSGSDEIRDVIRHLRNAVSHGRFDMESEDGKQITHIKFYDCPKKKPKERNFEEKFSVEELKTFLLEFSKSYVK
ncbi:hypothetical protein AGMMS49965_19830 [Bacteroidia bacterium]|nr:hypothetical protein AGMMS49965_19830 [Bacteroidia bacterium]